MEQLRPAFDEIRIMLDGMNDFRLTPTGTLKINRRPGSCTYIFNAFTGWFRT